MARTPLRHGCAWAVAIAFGSPLLAHENDPKLLDVEPRYEGPGYRRADSGGAPLPGGLASDGVTLRSWLTLAQLDGASLGNDCWGYVSPTGREYALMGTSNGTVFVEITDPDDAQVIDSVPGANSLWRDIKTYQDHAYAVSEGGGGIQVMDLSQIDSGNVTLVNTIDGQGTGNTHNVAIDTVSGFLYRTGGSGEGLRIYDLATPSNPTFVTSWATRYVHDAQAVTYVGGPNDGRQIVYACSGFNGGSVQPGLDVLDVTDKQNILVLPRVTYSNPAYSHQGWLSADRRYFFLGDELDEDGVLPTTTHIIDVSDPDNAFAADVFTNGNQAIGHNLYTRGVLVYEANYRSGLRVFDGTDPLNPVEVAYFDTVSSDDVDSFSGLWSTYPYFPSGTVLGSDMQKGLFVLSVDQCSVPVNYCIGAPNSVGTGADIATAGTYAFANNDLSLTASGAPAGKSGIFYFGPARVQTAFGEGVRCVGGNTRRMQPPVTISGNGSATRAVDLNAAPALGNVVPGSQANFQFWYRDDDGMGGTTFNLTDAVSITFCP